LIDLNAFTKSEGLMVDSPDRSIALFEQLHKKERMHMVNNLFMDVNLDKKMALRSGMIWKDVFRSQLLHKFVLNQF
jgi:hypothetical protein